MWEHKTHDTAKKTYTYEAATTGYTQKINAIPLAGYQNWRLPTVEELKNLVPLNERYFPNIQPSWHWSSNVHDDKTQILFTFNGKYEAQSVKEQQRHLLLVRSL